jgi:hypothetical protein
MIDLRLEVDRTEMQCASRARGGENAGRCSPPSATPCGGTCVAAHGLRRSKRHIALVGTSGVRGFDWLPNYNFDVRSQHEVDVGETDLEVRAHAYERGNAQTPLEERPTVRWSVPGEAAQ